MSLGKVYFIRFDIYSDSLKTIRSGNVSQGALEILKRLRHSEVDVKSLPSLISNPGEIVNFDPFVLFHLLIIAQIPLLIGYVPRSFIKVVINRLL